MHVQLRYIVVLANGICLCTVSQLHLYIYNLLIGGPWCLCSIPVTSDADFCDRCLPNIDYFRLTHALTTNDSFIGNDYTQYADKRWNFVETKCCNTLTLNIQNGKLFLVSSVNQL